MSSNLKVDSSNLSYTSNTPSSLEPQSDDVARFERLLQDNPQQQTNEAIDDQAHEQTDAQSNKQTDEHPHKHSNTTLDKEGSKQAEKTCYQSELSSIYSSLLSGLKSSPVGSSFMPAQNEANATKTDSSLDAISRERLQDMANKVLERIFVSLPQTSNGSEVRLILGGNLSELAGTEIILRRTLDGVLSVEMSCKTQEQLRKLASIQDKIKNSLEHSEERGVDVFLSLAEKSSSNDSEADKEAT